MSAPKFTSGKIAPAIVTVFVLSVPNDTLPAISNAPSTVNAPPNVAAPSAVIFPEALISPPTSKSVCGLMLLIPTRSELSTRTTVRIAPLLFIRISKLLPEVL